VTRAIVSPWCHSVNGNTPNQRLAPLDRHKEVKTVTYMTTAEVAELLRTSPETVRYWRHIGSGPRSFKVGRRVLYDSNDVTTWLAEQKENA